MSLINDVLRDLEKREQAGSAPAAVQAAFGSAPAAGSRPSPLRWPLAILLLLLCALLLWWLWPTEPESPQPIAATLEQVAQPAASQPATELATLEPVQPPTQSQPQELVPASVATKTEAAAPASTAPARLQSSVAPLRAPVPQTASLTRPIPAAQTAETAASSPSPTIQIRRRDASPAEREPKQATAALEQVHHDLSHGRLQRAEQQLYSLLQTQPSHAEARLLLARVYLRQERGADAVQLLQTGASGAQQPDFDLLLAAGLREAGQHAQAGELYQRLTRHYPESAQARLGLALSSEAAGQWQEAIASYQLLLNSPDPRTARLASQRLQLLQQQQQRALDAAASDRQATGQPTPSQGATNP